MKSHEWRGQSLILNLHIQPRSSRDELAGLHGDRIKVRITAPPVDGKANEHLIRFLARLFDVPRSSVTLLSGETGREKRICITNPAHLPPLIAPPLPPE